MAGLTPFLFTSERELRETGRWFEMYINPNQLGFSNKPLQNKVHTKGAIATLHWRNDLSEISATGASGWILKESMVQSMTKDLFHDLTNPKQPTDFVKKYGQTILKNAMQLKSTNMTLTARDFVKSLNEIALEDMYFTDDNGIEYYNQKKILIYTKRYPLGLILNGYFTSFAITELATDTQSINYTFNFTAETEDDSQQSASFLKNSIRELLVTANVKLG